MKKFLLGAFCAALTFICCFALVACGDKDSGTDGTEGSGSGSGEVKDTYPAEFVGDWVLSSATGTDGETYTVGGSVPVGVLGNKNAIDELSSDYQKLNITADGKFVWENDYTLSQFLDFKVINGSWRCRNSVTTFTVSSQETYTASVTGNTLSLVIKNEETNKDDVTVFTKA